MAVPEPPRRLRPRTMVWPAGQSLMRVHRLEREPTEFSAGNDVIGRFHHFRRADGVVVPALYCAENSDVAIAESLFRDVALSGPLKALRRARLASLALSTIRPTRDLTLVELLGHGLRRLELMPEQLTATESEDYVRTVAWARALHQSVPTADGLIWMSRLFNAAKAVMLFGDRVTADDLVSDSPVALAFGPGLAIVEAAANAAGIVVAD